MSGMGECHYSKFPPSQSLSLNLSLIIYINLIMHFLILAYNMCADTSCSVSWFKLHNILPVKGIDFPQCCLYCWFMSSRTLDKNFGDSEFTRSITVINN